MEGAYYKTKESVDEYIRLAEGVNGKLLIEKLKNYLPLNASLLEIGSGPGTDWKILNEYYEVVGSDSSLEFLSRLKENIPNGQFLELDAVTLTTDQTFNGVYSNKVLHHLKEHELETSMQRQVEILDPGGIVCHSFWRGEGSEIYNGLFVNYQTEKRIQNIFEKNFEVLLIESYKEFEAGDSILLIGKKV